MTSAPELTVKPMVYSDLITGEAAESDNPMPEPKSVHVLPWLSRAGGSMCV